MIADLGHSNQGEGDGFKDALKPLPVAVQLPKKLQCPRKMRNVLRNGNRDMRSDRLKRHPSNLGTDHIIPWRDRPAKILNEKTNA